MTTTMIHENDAAFIPVRVLNAAELDDAVYSVMRQAATDAATYSPRSAESINDLARTAIILAVGEGPIPEIQHDALWSEYLDTFGPAYTTRGRR